MNGIGKYTSSSCLLRSRKSETGRHPSTFFGTTNSGLFHLLPLHLVIICFSTISSKCFDSQSRRLCGILRTGTKTGFSSPLKFNFAVPPLYDPTSKLELENIERNFSKSFFNFFFPFKLKFDFSTISVMTLSVISVLSAWLLLFLGSLFNNLK